MQAWPTEATLPETMRGMLTDCCCRLWCRHASELSKISRPGTYLGSALGNPEGAPLAVPTGSHVPGQLIHALLHIPVVLRRRWSCYTSASFAVKSTPWVA